MDDCASICSHTINKCSTAAPCGPCHEATFARRFQASRFEFCAATICLAGSSWEVVALPLDVHCALCRALCSLAEHRIECGVAHGQAWQLCSPRCIALRRRSCGAPPLRNRTASWLDARSACLTPKPSVSPSPRRGFLLYPNVSFSGRAAPAARHSFLFGCAQPLDHLEFRASRLSLSQLKSMA